MAAGNYDIIIEKKANFSFTATFKQSTGAALDLTNRTLTGEIRRDFDNVLQATFTITKSDATKGIALIELSSAQTSVLTLDDSHYDIFSTLNTGNVERLLEGKATIVKNITQ